MALGGIAVAYTLIARWPGAAPVIGWNLNNPGFNDILSGTAAQQDAAILAGAAAWQTQGCSPFRFQFLANTSTTNAARDNVQAVIVRDAPSQALATTFVWSLGSEMLHFDMVFWDGDVMSGGGVVAGNIDGAGGIDMALAAVDNWDQGNDYWRIAIGANCGGGACTWSAPQGVEAGADVMSSTAVAAADFNSDGRLDLFLSGIDNWDQGDDYWRYRIGSGCNTSTGACTWSAIRAVAATGNQPAVLCGAATGRHIPNNAASLVGGGVTLANVQGDARKPGQYTQTPFRIIVFECAVPVLYTR
jgi:hypothetical protein